MSSGSCVICFNDKCRCRTRGFLDDDNCEHSEGARLTISNDLIDEYINIIRKHFDSFENPEYKPVQVGGGKWSNELVNYRSMSCREYFK